LSFVAPWQTCLQRGVYALF